MNLNTIFLVEERENSFQNVFFLSTLLGAATLIHNDTKHNDMQHNDAQHNELNGETKPKIILSVKFYSFKECAVCFIDMLSVIMQNALMVSVVAPSTGWPPLKGEMHSSKLLLELFKLMG